MTWPSGGAVSGVTAAAALASLVVVAELSDQPWIVPISYALLPMAVLMMGVGFAVLLTGHARLWLLFLCAPPSTLTAALSGIGAVSRTALILSWAVGVPLLLGLLLCSVCAVWVSNRHRDLARESVRHRAAGPSSWLPQLRWQNRARAVRLAAAIACALLALATPLLFGPAGRGLGVAAGAALLVGALTCLRIEATLLCLAGRPLVAFEGQRARATYAGRWTPLAPRTSLLPLMINEDCAARAGVAVMALLRESSLGPAFRAASSRLTPDQAQRLSLSLSLQPGGAGAIHYLSPAFPRQIQPVALTYSRLAEEAANPPDLQRWLAALTDHPGVLALAESDLAPELAAMLADVRDALLRDSYDPAIKNAGRSLRQTIAAFYGTIGPTPESGPPTTWPDALLTHVAAHERLLGTLRTTGSDPAGSK